jgi:molecular chaperone GrpE
MPDESSSQREGNDPAPAREAGSESPIEPITATAATEPGAALIEPIVESATGVDSETPILKFDLAPATIEGVAVAALSGLIESTDRDPLKASTAKGTVDSAGESNAKGLESVEVKESFGVDRETFAELKSTVVSAIESLASSLAGKFEKLAASFEREVRAEASRERVVDRLHKELEEYKQDLLLKILKPVFIDMIQLHDDIGKMIEATDRADLSADARRLLGISAEYQQAIEDILYRQGVEPFEVEGSTFDARRQRAAAPIPTSDPALAKTIAKRIRKGFAAEGKVIRPEIVSVYVPQR